MQAAQQRAKREREEHLESALKEYDKLKAAKSRVDRVSTTDPDARIIEGKPRAAPHLATTSRFQRLPRTA